jgi:hypothetical protein
VISYVARNVKIEKHRVNCMLCIDKKVVVSDNHVKVKGRNLISLSE